AGTPAGYPPSPRSRPARTPSAAAAAATGARTRATACAWSDRPTRRRSRPPVGGSPWPSPTPLGRWSDLDPLVDHSDGVHRHRIDRRAPAGLARRGGELALVAGNHHALLLCAHGSFG